jgi:hypothetical protein
MQLMPPCFAFLANVSVTFFYICLQAQQACAVALKGPHTLPVTKQQQQKLKAIMWEPRVI